ncbi:MAG: glycoside hydrolase family 1 [Verrucomicrobia bacterium]|nr:glycoside hydrolase family 1 [Verrucomicrobiota bacterium]
MRDTQFFYRAYWTSLNSGVAALTSDWSRARPPKLFWGEDKLALKNVQRLSLTYYGRQSGYFGEPEHFVFMVCPKNYPHLDFAQSGLFVAGSFNDWNPLDKEGQWQLTEEEDKEGATIWILRIARELLPAPESGAIEFKFVTGDHYWLPVPDAAPNVGMDDQGNRNFLLVPKRSGKHLFSFETPLPYQQNQGRQLGSEIGGNIEYIPLQAGVFLRDLHTDLRLGALVKTDSTVFRLFAPRAQAVKISLFQNLSDRGKEWHEMHRMDEGLVWEWVVPGNKHGWYYDLRVSGDTSEPFSHFDSRFNILDPYALAVVGPEGPAIVIDRKTLPQPVSKFTPPHWHDLVIVEAHVRDLIGQAPADIDTAGRSRFSGLTRWLQESSCYLRTLGVNAVEFQPLQVFDSVDPAEYAWGYMPVNYFSPASQYASDASKATQIGECAAMIKACHDAGLAVILDVVYNHVGEPNYLQFIDKQYYFLLDENGNYLNYSGCGNTLDADAAMVRRLIVDSLQHWIEVFDVDGFRFDLGELIGVEALSFIEQELKKIKPSIVLIAEPWSFRGHIAHELRRTGFASWNDSYREGVRNYVRGKASADHLSYLFRGCMDSLTRFPAQTVNYVESHDDRCWIDKITENPGYNGWWPTANDRRRTHMMLAILMLSAGIPMLSAGMDMLKSKGGANNTYLRGDLNELDYERARQYPTTWQYFRQWIALRASKLGRLVRLDGLPSEGYYAMFSHRSAMVMLINADLSNGPSQLLFACNPHFEPVDFAFEGVCMDGFIQIADAERCHADLNPLSEPVLPLHSDNLRLPPLSFGLWCRL